MNIKNTIIMFSYVFCFAVGITNCSDEARKSVTYACAFTTLRQGVLKLIGCGELSGLPIIKPDCVHTSIDWGNTQASLLAIQGAQQPLMVTARLAFGVLDDEITVPSSHDIVTMRDPVRDNLWFSEWESLEKKISLSANHSRAMVKRGYFN